MEKFKKVLFISALIILVFAVAAFSGCGKKDSNDNIVKIDGSSNTNEGELDRNYDVLLDERTPETQYSYSEDDLSLIDTVTGKKVTLGMTQAEVEEITGAPEQTDRDTMIYDGIVVKYIDGTAVTISVSSGMFKGEKGTRYKTSRGIGIGTSLDDFKKAYGDSYLSGSESADSQSGETTKTPSRAARFFKKDGRKIEYLGTELSSEHSSADKSNYYLQDFMFSNSDGNIATMRVSVLSAVTGGI